MKKIKKFVQRVSNSIATQAGLVLVAHAIFFVLLTRTR